MRLMACYWYNNFLDKSVLIPHLALLELFTQVVEGCQEGLAAFVLKLGKSWPIHDVCVLGDIAMCV